MLWRAHSPTTKLRTLARESNAASGSVTVTGPRLPVPVGGDGVAEGSDVDDVDDDGSTTSIALGSSARAST